MAEELKYVDFRTFNIVGRYKRVFRKFIKVSWSTNNK